MYIMQRQKARAEHLVRRVKMTKVRTREAATGIAVTSLVQRKRVGAIFGALDVHPSIRGERGAVAPHPGGCHAVEEIHTPRDTLDQILGNAYTHDVARPVFRKRLVANLEHGVHVRLRLSHGESADRVTRPVIHVTNGNGRFHSQVGVYASLYDGEESLPGVCASFGAVPRPPARLQMLECLETASEPAHAALAGIACTRGIRLSGYHVVELHDHVRAKIPLDLHHGLGREREPRAIHVTAELDSFL